MELDNHIFKKCEWLRGVGPRSNIAISTRIRIARNVRGKLFFNRANETEREEVLEIIFAGIKKGKFLKDGIFLRMKDLTEVDRAFLVERHLMSRGHMQEANAKGLVVEEKEIVSTMVNEEDHLRLQVLQSGFNITEAWRIIDELDTELAQYIPFDYSNKYGYLTACPTNTGTGLRASVMLHLSALVLTRQIENVFDATSKLGLTIRGFYGEGTEGIGDFFQISNQVALGVSEMDILDNMERVINKIIDKEEETRKNLVKSKKEEVSDRIFRSYGTLKSARIITSSEAIKLLSTIRLGTDLGVIDDIDVDKLNEVLILTQPAHLQKIFKCEISPSERDIKRADLIREKLGCE